MPFKFAVVCIYFHCKSITKPTCNHMNYAWYLRTEYRTTYSSEMAPAANMQADVIYWRSINIFSAAWGNYKMLFWNLRFSYENKPHSGAVKALKLRQLFKCGTESEILHEVSPDHVDSFEKWCPAESTWTTPFFGHNS